MFYQKFYKSCILVAHVRMYVPMQASLTRLSPGAQSVHIVAEVPQVRQDVSQAARKGKSLHQYAPYSIHPTYQYSHQYSPYISIHPTSVFTLQYSPYSIYPTVFTLQYSPYLVIALTDLAKCDTIT